MRKLNLEREFQPTKTTPNLSNTSFTGSPFKYYLVRKVCLSALVLLFLCAFLVFSLPVTSSVFLRFRRKPELLFILTISATIFSGLPLLPCIQLRFTCCEFSAIYHRIQGNLMNHPTQIDADTFRSNHGIQ